MQYRNLGCVYGLWMGHQPSLYTQLTGDPIYLSAIVSTVIYLAIGVNHMFLALRCPTTSCAAAAGSRLC